MIFPWVSRAVYEAQRLQCDHYRTQLEHANQARHEVVALYQQLQDKYDRLVNRLMDRQIPEFPQFEQPPPLLEPRVVAAIGERAPPGSLVYDQIYREAERLAQAGIGMDTILDAVLHGEEAPV